MKNDLRLPRITVQHKLVLAHVAVIIVSVLLAEWVALAALLIIARPTLSLPAWGVHIAVVTTGAGLLGLLLGAWASRRVARRVEHALETSRAWLRGNLALRIADPISDDLGLLAEQMDLLAEHLERDEQDVDELRERNARLTDQVRALAVVEERNRLARELHDRVKQQLFSLAMTASGVRARLDGLRDRPKDFVEMVQEIETTAQAAQREMTRLIEDLRPHSLQDQGLADALNDYTLLFGAREHMLVYLEVQGNDGLLPPNVAEALYRTAQEAMHNVARHARATRVDVHVRCIPELVALTIRDNGIGFDTEQARRGLGLASMEERMIDVDGRLTVESQIGGGTTVLAEVALTGSLGPRSELARLDRDRPTPTIENWAWLGQRLVIPVGQTWPWLPADQVHLRRPLIEPGTLLSLEREIGFLGLWRAYTLRLGQRRRPLTRVHQGRVGYEWECERASWALRHVRGLGGRMVLMRNGQPLAAMQQQGRLLNTWTEIVYDGRGYRLSLVRGQPGNYVLADEGGEEALLIARGESPGIELRRALPLPLIVMVAARTVEETASTAAADEAAEAGA